MSEAFKITKSGDKRIVQHVFHKGERHSTDEQTFEFIEDCVVDVVEVYRRPSVYMNLSWCFEEYKWNTLRPKYAETPVPKAGFWARLFRRRVTIPEARVVEK